MTAEVAVMNWRGIALASDSAVVGHQSEKVYYSVNKLFELSVQIPVGIMIYGTSAFLGMSWENIIKLYRKQLNGKVFDTLQQYIDDFLQFVSNLTFEDHNRELIEKDFIFHSIRNEIIRVYEDMKEIYMNLYNELEESDQLEIFEQTYFEKGEKALQKALRQVQEKHYIGNFQEEDYQEILKREESSLKEMLEKYYIHKVFKREWIDLIIQFSCLSVLKYFGRNQSRIVFAGYGEKEIYPSVITYKIEGKFNGKLKYELMEQNSRKLSPINTAEIIPLSKVDIMNRFIRGIDDRFEKEAYKILKTMLNMVPNFLVEKLSGILKEEIDIEVIKQAVQNELKDLYEQYEKEIKEETEQYVSSLNEIVHSLPLKELAELAETLIRLTSYSKTTKKNISVGPPVDVAIITKGDGFIWVKNKGF